MTAEDLIERLDLEPLEPEGGWWAQSHIDPNGTAIYYLLRSGEVSLLHRLPGPETYFFHAGAPLDLLVLGPDGGDRLTIGPDLDAGHLLQFTVAGGLWQGSSSTGGWTLVGTAMAPPFRFEDYEPGSRARLAAAFPEWAARIAELTPAE